MKTKRLFKIFVLVTGMFLPVVTNAQTDPPPDPMDTPIDGGLSILLAAGIGYGVKKAYSNNKKKIKNNTDEDVINK